MEFLKAPTAPDPHEVAVAITKSHRGRCRDSARTVSLSAGPSAPIVANAAIEPLQQQMVAGFGLEQAIEVPSSRDFLGERGSA